MPARGDDRFGRASCQKTRWAALLSLDRAAGATIGGLDGVHWGDGQTLSREAYPATHVYGPSCPQSRAASRALRTSSSRSPMRFSMPRSVG